MLAIPRTFLPGALLGAFFLGAGVAVAGELVVDGRLVRYEPVQGDSHAVAFQMESKVYQNTYLLDCSNQRFLWIENVDLRTGEETGNNVDADWKALNPRSTVANAVHRKACLDPSHGQTTAAEETARLDQLPLRQGMRYSQAREIILDAGWQAPRKPVQEVPEFGVVNELYYDNGWQEINDCAGSGTMPCRFEFIDMHNRALIVITEGECLPGTELCDLAVSRWYLEQPSASVSHQPVLEDSSNAAWKTNQGVALIHLPEQQARVGVIFPVEHRCEAAVFYVAGMSGLESAAMNIDRKPLGTLMLGEFTLDDGTPISGAGLSDTGVQALSQGHQLQIQSEQGDLDVPLTGSADAFRAANAFCRSELAASAPPPTVSSGAVHCDAGEAMPLNRSNHERFMQQVMQVAGNNGMGGVNNPGLEVRNFREAMQQMGYSLTATIEAFCATSPMAMVTNPSAFAFGSDLIRAYERLSGAERRAVYCLEEIAAIDRYKTGPDSWFVTGEFPGGKR